MTTTATRETLIGAGEHIGASRLLSDNYTDAEYVEAIMAAREAGIGEAYANAILGKNVDTLLHGVDDADADVVVRAAESSLRRRGIDPKKASYRQYADALTEVSA